MAWMKQKLETDPTPSNQNAPSANASLGPKPSREKTVEKIVNIGQSVQIKGELTGNEDLTIEGRVDGRIMLKDHNLTIGANGRITAEVHAKTVAVLGHVTGNITADDKVEIASSGTVEGDVRAPRVAISDGATFKGSIDMDRKGKPPAMTGKPASAGVPTPPAKEMARSASAPQR